MDVLEFDPFFLSQCHLNPSNLFESLDVRQQKKNTWQTCLTHACSETYIAQCVCTFWKFHWRHKFHHPFISLEIKHLHRLQGGKVSSLCHLMHSCWDVGQSHSPLKSYVLYYKTGYSFHQDMLDSAVTWLSSWIVHHS